ncbi:mitochondrial ribosomal protein MRP51 [Pyronema omphalodes]|nr:mitochondrial ribosomal protein MRP51 [Pyronema omphalodes]
MSSKAFSPAANLLRRSRLMSMPAPIQPPQSFSIHAPPAAPYPTVQAITTPRSSAYRGDWGLKRDLPVQVSQKTVYMRYNDLDTIEHMTTFESAHDDVYTLKKWQEMDIPLVKDQAMDDFASYDPRTEKNFQYKSTVFDGVEEPEKYKWRYQGPYVAGMGEKKLKAYIEERIIPQKEAFLKFVARHQAIEKVKQKYLLRNEEKSIAEIEAEAELEADVSKVDPMSLRAEHQYLEKLVIEFLDIPRQKPNRTHPSAGLHYIRSSAYAHNDPKLGPQEQKKEVLGRPLNHHGASGSLVGVGGVVARVSSAYAQRRQVNDRDRSAVQPFRPIKGAHINASGKILLDVERVAPAVQQASWGFAEMVKRKAVNQQAKKADFSSQTDQIVQMLNETIKKN